MPEMARPTSDSIRDEALAARAAETRGAGIRFVTGILVGAVSATVVTGLASLRWLPLSWSSSRLPTRNRSAADLVW